LTSTPQYDFDVNGTIHYTTSTASSDARFKTNVMELSGPESVSKLAQLRPIRFEWNEFVQSRRKGYELHKPTFGFLAQELQQVLPELVSTWSLSDDCQDALSVNYEKLIPICVSAIQHLQRENDELRQRVDALESAQS
jgi:hypothetical protein